MSSRFVSVSVGIVGLVALLVSGCSGNAVDDGAVPESDSSSVPSQPDIKTCAEGGVCQDGDIGPGGGTVFIVSNGAQSWGSYFEAAPNNWSGGSGDPEIEWCNAMTQIKPSTGGAVGTGSENTDLMVSACTSGAGNRARAYDGGGLSDWFVPSSDELNLLILSDFGGFNPGDYWSSSQDGASSAHFMNYKDKYKDSDFKTDPLYVRPVRTFGPATGLS